MELQRLAGPIAVRIIVADPHPIGDRLDPVLARGDEPRHFELRRRGRVGEPARARRRYPEALGGVAHLGMVQLQAVALALAIGHHQHDDVPIRVDKAARRLLVVQLALERIRGRRRDDIQPFDGLPIAELGRQMLFDIERVMRARHQFVRRHHHRKQHRRQHRDAGEENIGRTRHIRLRFARSSRARP